MKKLMFLAIVFASAVSCADSELIEVFEVEKSSESVSAENSDAIPIDEALSALDRVLVHIDLPTRGRCRKADKITTITKERMFGVLSRSASNIPEGDLLYVVNFEKKSGYAILGAKSNLDTVIMVGDNGNFDSSLFERDSVPKIKNYFTESELYCEEDDEYYIGNRFDDNPDDVAVQLFMDYIAGRCDDLGNYGSGGNSSPAVTNKIKLLRTTWHQGAPFNLNFHEAPASDTDNQGRRPAGCTTIAAAQIITYLKNVSLKDKFGITTSTWQNIESVGHSKSDTTEMLARKDVASMVKQMADGIGVRYNFFGSGGTFATPTKVKKYLERLGYNVTKYLGCSDNVKSKIDLSILHNKPVFIAALDKNLNGHAWVMDGLWCPTTQDYDYVHCNIGWGGVSDGWYVYSVFDTTDSRVEFDKETGNDEFKYTWCYRTLIID